MEKYFENVHTGEVNKFPAHYERLFPDSLIPVDGPGECVDCMPSPEVIEEDPIIEIPDFGEEEEYEQP